MRGETCTIVMNTLSLLYPTVLALGMKLSSGIVTTPCVADCEIKVKSLKMTSIATYRRRLFINPIYTNTIQLSYTLLVILKMSPTHWECRQLLQASLYYNIINVIQEIIPTYEYRNHTTIYIHPTGQIFKFSKTAKGHGLSSKSKNSNRRVAKFKNWPFILNLTIRLFWPFVGPDRSQKYFWNKKTKIVLFMSRKFANTT